VSLVPGIISCGAPCESLVSTTAWLWLFTRSRKVSVLMTFTDRSVFQLVSTPDQALSAPHFPSQVSPQTPVPHCPCIRYPSSARRLLCLGLEGSANKLGAGIISHSPTSKATLVTVLSNVRHTYITPPGEGFLPSDTARHHREWVMKVIKEAVRKAGVRLQDLDCIAFTKGGSIASAFASFAFRGVDAWGGIRMLIMQVREWARHCKSVLW
jgi:hypothetical protein